jgi:hypothetical protein
MKMLCYLFSFYVFYLSAVPCCSEDNCNDEIKTEHSDNHSQDQKEEDCNTCSPFFTCGTCSGLIYTRSDDYFKEVYYYKEQLVAVYKSRFSDDFFAKIWQPPKIFNDKISGFTTF